MFIVTYIFFPVYCFNEFYIIGSSILSTLAFLYYFSNVVFIMHQKPSYFETVTMFKIYKTQDTNKVEESIKPEMKLINDVNTYLTKKFRRLFKHVLIIVDSLMMGILSYWFYLHYEFGETDHQWVKNLGIFGGYMSICGKIHIYSGKIILYYLKTKKETFQEREIQRRRRRSLSDEYWDEPETNVIKTLHEGYLSDIRDDSVFTLESEDSGSEVEIIEEISNPSEILSHKSSDGEIIINIKKKIFNQCRLL
jgi:hypothetical protein